MSESCCIIQWYVDGKTYQEFLDDRMMRDACLMQLQHLWESAYKVYKFHKKTIWPEHKRIVWLRHFISHDYMGITFEQLWMIVTQKIPELLIVLKEMNK